MASPNRFFDAQTLDLLRSPGQWRLISSHAPPDVRPVRRPGRSRERWSQTHTHSHPHREFLFALRGGGFYGYEGTLYPCRPGTVFLFDCFERHDQGYPSSAPEAAHLWISPLDDRVLASVVSVPQFRRGASGSMRWMLTSQEIGFYPLEFLRGLSGEEVPAEWKRARILSALWAILVKMVEKGFQPPEAESSREAFQKQVIEAIQHHVRKTAGAGLGLSSLARMAGYSKFHFFRLFKQHTGWTVHEYINRCRREKLASMSQEGHSHKQIGAALGFSCPAAFSRWYAQQKRFAR